MAAVNLFDEVDQTPGQGWGSVMTSLVQAFHGTLGMGELVRK